MSSALDISKLSSEMWRMNNLYHIQDKAGVKLPFSMWPEQRELYENMWYLNIILKARQRGLTTFTQLFMLDRCLFHAITSAGVIAHTTQDASTFFNTKSKHLSLIHISEPTRPY